MLQISNLTCGYQSGFSLREINISLPDGVFAGIIGPNGSGKSTLFKTLTGDLTPRSGTIQINGQPLQSFSLRERAQQIAIVSQFSELSTITVLEYVLLGRVPYRSQFQFFNTDEDLKIAQHYLELTGIAHLGNKPVSELSGGERQMACIASALAQKPRLLLLDEATSHLDITHQVNILNLLQQLNETDGITILMIIHDLNLAAEYCNHLIMMKQGGINTQGTPENVLTYEHIENVYNTLVVVDKNPVSGKPAIFTVSNKGFKSAAAHLNKKDTI